MIGMKNHHVTAATLATRGMVQLAANMKTNATDEETKKLGKEFLSKLAKIATLCHFHYFHIHIIIFYFVQEYRH